MTLYEEITAAIEIAKRRGDPLVIHINMNQYVALKSQFDNPAAEPNNACIQGVAIRTLNSPQNDEWRVLIYGAGRVTRDDVQTQLAIESNPTYGSF